MKKTIFQRFLLKYKKLQLSKSPQVNLVWGFFLYTFVGFLLLSIPFFHKSEVSFLDNLFISTSAISTTGLATISVFDSYTFWGQFTIMLLIQIGGIGYMTLTTYYLLFTTKRITKWHSKIIGAEFTMPKNIEIRDFIKSAIIFTLVMETLGAIALYFASSQFNVTGFESVWFAIFHSISSFCTAGFSLFNNGFIDYATNGYINSIISILSISGSLGFIVITDLWYKFSGKSKKISFTTKIITWSFLLLLSFGTLLFFFTEPVINNGNASLTKSFFQAMTAMTTVGFNTIITGELRPASLLFIIFLMYVGASPSGTAGGIKITTLTAMIAILKSRLSGQQKISFLNRTIPFTRLYVATSTFIMYTSIIFLFTFFLMYSENFKFEHVLFEVASALGTVGLSTGITGELSDIGKSLIIILMFVGRVGVLTFGFALLHRNTISKTLVIKDDLAV